MYVPAQDEQPLPIRTALHYYKRTLFSSRAHNPHTQKVATTAALLAVHFGLVRLGFPPAQRLAQGSIGAVVNGGD